VIVATYVGSNVHLSSTSGPILIVFYDANNGFVTGGGWINSPVGAYVLDPTLTGKANFGFVSRYKKGATVPTGDTEFQFQVANLSFKSKVYEWLVISGGFRAEYQGTGTINGAGNYGFILTAIDEISRVVEASTSSGSRSGTTRFPASRWYMTTRSVRATRPILRPQSPGEHRHPQVVPAGSRRAAHQETAPVTRGPFHFPR
jgi:hypothetical protein